MRFDLYAELASLQACPTSAPLPGGLASGFVDGCTVWCAEGELDRDSEAGRRKKNEARDCYMRRAAAAALHLPAELRLDMELGAPLRKGWLAVEIRFRLRSPWYSKDDLPFHVLHNPVRKDRVFGVPYMSAASWKGLLRWACRMHAGLYGHLREHRGEVSNWSDPPWIIYLFGNEKREGGDFLRGALVFYPTWFDRVGFEVINPHSREKRAGREPITYEVVPPDTEGALRLLYAPLQPGGVRRDVEPVKALRHLLDAVRQLLTVYGFSAKRTGGWGIAEVTDARANGGEWEQDNPIQRVKEKLPALLGSTVEKA